MRSRVLVYNSGTGRGPNQLVRIIEDAAEVGCGDQANSGFPLFFTLPYDHEANVVIAAIGPYNAHVEIQRQESIGGAWATVMWGLIVDFDHTANEVVWQGLNYLALYADTKTALKTKYTNAACSTIISNEATAAAAETDSRCGFVALGTIDTTSQTMTVLSDYQAHLDLMLNAAQVVQSGTSARPVFSIDAGTRLTASKAPPFTFSFSANKGTRNPAINLEYSGRVSAFRLKGGYSDLASDIIGIAQKTSGATILYSNKSGLPSATYGKREEPAMYGMLPDQAALDRMTSAEASLRSKPFHALALAVRDLSPSEVAVSTSYPVTIKRGILNLDHTWYTLWAWRWVAHPNGSEDLFVSVLPEEMGLSSSPPAPDDPSTGSSTATTTSVATYKIKPGDTLSGLAKTWGTTVAKIQSATNAQVGKISGVVKITNVSQIKAGALLVRP